MDIDLKSNAEDPCKITEPISSSSDKLQSGKSIINDATHIWKEVLMKNMSDEPENINLHRYHRAITNYHLLA